MTGNATPAMMAPSELAALRRSVGLSQVQLAKMLGCDKGTVSRWESGARPIGAIAAAGLRAVIQGAQAATKPTTEQPISAQDPVYIRDRGPADGSALGDTPCAVPSHSGDSPVTQPAPLSGRSAKGAAKSRRTK